MAETILVTATPYEESKTIYVGSVTNFTIDLSHAQRFVVDMTGDGTLTVVRPVNQIDQEITLNIRCAAAVILTLPANSYDEAGLITTLNILPTTIVGAGGYVLTCTTTTIGLYWEISSASSAMPIRVLIHDANGAGLPKGTIVYADGSATAGVLNALPYTPVGVTTFPLGVIETVIDPGANGFASRLCTLAGLAANGLVVTNLVACAAGGSYGTVGAAPSAAGDIYPGVIGRCTALAGTATIRFDFTDFPSHVHGTGALQNLAVTTAKIADAAVTDVKIASKIYKTPGKPGVSSFGFTAGDVVGLDTLTLGAQTYTFRAAASGTPLLDILPGGASPWTAAADITAAVAAINANPSREFDALDMGSDVLGLIEKTVTGVAPLTAASRASVKVSAANAKNAVSAAVVQRVTGQYSITANDVLSLAIAASAEIVIAAFPVAGVTPPSFASITVRTSGGVFKSVATLGLVIAQFNTNFYGLKLNDSATVLALNDIVAFQIEL